MPSRTLRVEIQEDDVFIDQIDSHIRSVWDKLSKSQQAVLRVLVAALNSGGQVKTPELRAVVPGAEAVDTIICALRDKFNIPIIVSVGVSGGYRLPICRAECNLFLQGEATVLYRKIKRLLGVHKAMAKFGVTKPSGLEPLEYVYKAYRLEAVDGQQGLVARRRNERR